MNPISYLWSRVPESGTKDWLRAVAHSLRRGHAAHFSFRSGVFQTDFAGARVRTLDHPFLLPAAQEQYQTKHRITEGEVVIDAGAFSGHLSLYFASQVGHNGLVIAIEPDKTNLQILRANFDLNTNMRQLTVAEAILWDRVETVEFCEQGTVASSAFWMPSGKARTQKVTATLDSIVRDLNLSRLDFIKMDIEGAEVKALAGARETIRRFTPDFAVASYHIVDGERTLSHVERALSDHGYEVETLSFGKECITYGTAPRG